MNVVKDPASSPTAGPEPKINDQYFFDFSKTELADKAISRRDEAADRLQKLVIWLWGIYTGAAAIGFTLSEKRLSLGATLVVGGASAALIAVYWITVWVRMPKVVEFDPRSPDDIKDAYKTLVLSKQRRLSLGLALSVVAAMLVAIALLVASQPGEEEAAVSLPAVGVARAESGAEVAVTTTLTPERAVGVKILEGEAVLAERTFLSDSDGRLQISIPLGADAGSGGPAGEEEFDLRVVLSWSSGEGTEIEYSTEVAEPGA